MHVDLKSTAPGTTRRADTGLMLFDPITTSWHSLDTGAWSTTDS